MFSKVVFGLFTILVFLLISYCLRKSSYCNQLISGRRKEKACCLLLALTKAPKSHNKENNTYADSLVRLHPLQHFFELIVELDQPVAQLVLGLLTQRLQPHLILLQDLHD